MAFQGQKITRQEHADDLPPAVVDPRDTDHFAGCQTIDRPVRLASTNKRVAGGDHFVRLRHLSVEDLVALAQSLCNFGRWWREVGGRSLV
jgi:hypothetical protein